MGFFSWVTADTGQTIASKWAPNGAIENGKPAHYGKVTLLLEHGEPVTGLYDGYGRLETKDARFLGVGGAVDIFALVYADKIHEKLDSEEHMEEMRRAAFAVLAETDAKIKLVINEKLNWEDVETSEYAASQGYFFDEHDFE